MEDKKNQRLNRFSSSEEKNATAEIVYDTLVDFFFDKVSYIYLAYSDLGEPITAGITGTNSTTNFGVDSRIIDSSSGLYMRPGLESRMRCSFYLKNAATADAYLLSPCVYTGLSLPNPLTSVNSLSAYIGLRFIGRDVYVVVKESGGSEKIFTTGITLTMYNATFSDTYVLDIKYNVRFTDIYINGSLIGSYSSDLVGTTPLPGTFYAFFAPARTTNGANYVNIVAEHIQFIQSKQ